MLECGFHVHSSVAKISNHHPPTFFRCFKEVVSQITQSSWKQLVVVVTTVPLVSITPLFMTTTITICNGGGITDTNIINKKRPRRVSFSPDLDWRKEDSKRSHRKRWKQQVRNRGKLTMEQDDKAYQEKAFLAFKALSDEDNRKFLLQRYEKDLSFQVLLYKCIKNLGLSHGPGQEAMKMSLEELTENPRRAEKVSDKNTQNLYVMHCLLQLDPKFGQKCKDSDSSESEGSCGIHWGTPFRNLANMGRLSEGSDSTQGSGSSTLSEASTPSPELKRSRTTAAEDTGDASSENR
jgi:hypothetical protein